MEKKHGGDVLLYLSDQINSFYRNDIKMNKTFNRIDVELRNKKINLSLIQ